jgi:acyl-CoA synthetase (AMP-forming)/AMP-acid ligase II
MLNDPVLDLPVNEIPDPQELVEAAMQWHFNPETGSRYWLERAKTLDFDPRKDVHTLTDLSLFPNTVNELRDVSAMDLIPQGCTPADVLGIYESGGTTGAPKRVVCLQDWMDRWLSWNTARLEERGLPRGANWLGLMPSGPHIFGAALQLQPRLSGGLLFTVDMDPRWVKRLLREGQLEEAGRYAEHLVQQAQWLLETQDVSVMVTTPPLLERLVRSDKLTKLIQDRITFIQWGGAHMDADTRHLFRTEVFPGISLQGAYGSTMVLGGTVERAGLSPEDPCIFDPFGPYISFSVVEPQTGAPVGYGERGQVVMNHVSKGMLLPNNPERDLATRIAPLTEGMGDSVADIAPLATFEDTTVVEGVY